MHVCEMSDIGQEVTPSIVPTVDPTTSMRSDRIIDETIELGPGQSQTWSFVLKRDATVRLYMTGESGRGVSVKTTGSSGETINELTALGEWTILNRIRLLPKGAYTITFERPLLRINPAKVKVVLEATAENPFEEIVEKAKGLSSYALAAMIGGGMMGFILLVLLLKK